MKLKATILAVAAALGIGTAGVYAQGPSSGSYGMGPGMMGEYGHGRGGGMMGPGTMGGGYGYGMGPGMMGGGYGCGMGPHMGRGFAGGAALSSLDLSDAQRTQVLPIQDQLRKSNWDLMGKMQDEMAKQRDLFADGKRDRAAITAVNKRMFDLRQQMLDNSFDAAEKVETILTPQQREQLKKQWGPGWMMGF